MPDAGQFSMLNLLGSTALDWTMTPPTTSAAAPAGLVEDDDRADEDAEDQQPEARTADRGQNYYLDSDRALARSWPARARDNIAAIRLSKELESTGRAPTPEEQEALLRFIGFGATDLAQNCFPLPGATSWRDGWEEIGQALADLTSPAEYAALQRATQYAHFTPEFVVRSLWATAQHLGFTGGRVLEPGMGTGLFFALLPPALRGTVRGTGVEYDPVTARIAALIHPDVRVRQEDYTRSRLGGGFDAVVGNPPFANRVVRADPAKAKLGLMLHDFFIAQSIARLRPGGLALFLTSTGTMDKVSTTARTYIASMADLIGAVRLPEGSMHATAGTDVVIDVLVFQRRQDGQTPAGADWIDLHDIILDDADLPPGGDDTGAESAPDAPTDAAADHATAAPAHRQERRGVVAVNSYFATHPEMVLGTHSQKRGIYGPGLTYTCRATPDDTPLELRLRAALRRLPAGIFTPAETGSTSEEPADEPAFQVGTAADGATIKEGSYVIGSGGRLMQILQGHPVAVPIKEGKGKEQKGRNAEKSPADEGAGTRAIPVQSAKIIRALLPIRDAVRAVLRAQAADPAPLAAPSAAPGHALAAAPWAAAQVRLRIAYSNFIRYFGPLNHTLVTITTDPETGEEREAHRRPNLAPFADDPDCNLVASIEEYDLESGMARMGPVFRERVIAPPTAPLITNAADALAVTLSERGRVDPEHVADLLETDTAAALAQLGTTVFRNPITAAWETADAYLSGAVRTKLAVAEAAAAIDTDYARNVTALRDVQPEDIRASDITARLGAPWVPTEVVEAFSEQILQSRTRIHHCLELATWSVDQSDFIGTAASTSEWGTSRRHAGLLLHDALNSATPQIYDIVVEEGVERRVLNPEATEAAKEKLVRIKTAFTDWIWTDPDRTDRLARIYNDKFNGLVPRHFDGRHLTLPGASNIIKLRDFQKRVVWRAISAGSCYIAHAVGAGKTFSIAAAIMEQKRLGLITKAMLVVPGHCLAQASREFLQLYPTARILVADEVNFVKEKRARFLARVATSNWDAVIITHSAFRFIAVPTAFERAMIEDQMALYESVALTVGSDDRTTRKRIEAMKERLAEKLEALKAKRDNMLTLEELGIDQIIVDEAQEFRKLSFATNRTTLKGVDPDGSQRAWDLYVKSRYIDSNNRGRALIQASGTPITNTLGEMFSLLRFQREDLLRDSGVQAFDAWASAFGDTVTELELQPSGTYKTVERFSTFINVPELIQMFRSVADVVLKDDLRGYLKLPAIRGGQRQLITAKASPAFREYQKHLAERIRTIEERTRRVQAGDDILLAVITDGRHAAIDMRLVWDYPHNEPDNKLNRLIANVHRIWSETAANRYIRSDGTPYPLPGAGQMIFSDLGTVAVETKRGFSAYRWIKQELIRLGVPASQIAFMQDFKRSVEKQRLFNDFNAGRVRVLIGSSETMGTGVNVQQRLIALHHLDVPWLPSQIEQREGRIERQGNQNPEVEIIAYATLTSVDSTLWQNNERKARFIAAALSGDRSIRRIEDIGTQANQFALAKAIASGDGRLMQKAGLESELHRLQRQRAAHFDDQHDIRRRINSARFEQAGAERRIADIHQDLTRRVSTRGDAFTMVVAGRNYTDRRAAGAALLSKMHLGLLEANTRTWTIGRIGGFDLTCGIRRDLSSQRCAAELLLERTNYQQVVDVTDDITPLGLIARLESVLDRFEAGVEGQTRILRDATNRRAGYEARVGVPFALQAELDEKLARLADLNADLAKTESILPAKGKAAEQTPRAA